MKLTLNCDGGSTGGFNRSVFISGFSFFWITLTTIFLSSPVAWGASEKSKAKNKAEEEKAAKPLITTIFPAGGQRGTTVEVLVTGTNLVSGTEGAVTGAIRLSGSGVTARILPNSDAKGVRLSVNIDANAELRERDVRLVTRDGVSNRYRFIVGQLPEINEVEPNSNIATAQRVASLPVLVNARIDQNDQDFFRFAAKGGQTLVCEIQARAIVPYIADAVPGWFDAVLTLYDATGKALDSVDDFRFRPDPTLIFRVPKDGDYVVGIRDILYRGRADFIYRLSVGALPSITHVFPLGGKRDSVVPVELHGANLPEPTQKTTFTSDPNPRRSIWVTAANGLVSNRVTLAAGDFPEALETEPNDTTQQANRVTAPVTVNGRIQKSNDADWYVFAAKAGEKLVMEVLARRLDSPLDSVLTLYNSKGTEVIENDDTVDPTEPLMMHHADSRIAFTFPQAGDYFLRIRDAQQKGGDAYAYRLVIGPPEPDFGLRVSPDTISAGQGGSALLTVSAVRKDGFSGEISLSIQGLPAGFVASNAVIPANQDEVSLTITASPNAPLNLVTPTIVGSATIGTKSVVRKATASEPLMQAFSTTHNVFTKELLLAITAPGPISISTSNPDGAPLELIQGGELQITVKTIRKGETKGGIAVAVPKIPQGINAKAPYIPGDKDETILTVSATKQAVPGTVQNLIIVGTLKSGGASISCVAPAIPVKIIAAGK